MTTSRKRGKRGEERRRGEAQQEREKRVVDRRRRRRGRENRRQREKERDYIGSNTRLHFNKREGRKFFQQFLSRKIACLFDVFHVFVCSFGKPSVDLECFGSFLFPRVNSDNSVERTSRAGEEREERRGAVAASLVPPPRRGHSHSEANRAPNSSSTKHQEEAKKEEQPTDKDSIKAKKDKGRQEGTRPSRGAGHTRGKAR